MFFAILVVIKCTKEVVDGWFDGEKRIQYEILFFDVVLVYFWLLVVSIGEGIMSSTPFSLSSSIGLIFILSFLLQHNLHYH